MSPAPRFWKADPGGIDIAAYIQPRSARNQVCGLHDGALKLKISAAPVAGQANQELIRFLSKTLKIAKRQISLRQGHTGRRKLIHIACPLPEQAGLIQGLEQVLRKCRETS
ncbi:MAG: DUF167 domain-containing protein [Desulfobacterales bacterium]|jgi:uncharacterized protein (TIGR00251 family)